MCLILSYRPRSARWLNACCMASSQLQLATVLCCCYPLSRYSGTTTYDDVRMDSFLTNNVPEVERINVYELWVDVPPRVKELHHQRMNKLRPYMATFHYCAKGVTTCSPLTAIERTRRSSRSAGGSTWTRVLGKMYWERWNPRKGD